MRNWQKAYRDFTDNGNHFTNQTSLSTAPQIEVMTTTSTSYWASITFTPNFDYDNGTNLALGTATVGAANTWCINATSTGEYAVIVSNNGSTAGAASIKVHKALDNTTTSA